MTDSRTCFQFAQAVACSESPSFESNAGAMSSADFSGIAVYSACVVVSALLGPAEAAAA